MVNLRTNALHLDSALNNNTHVENTHRVDIYHIEYTKGPMCLMGVLKCLLVTKYNLQDVVLTRPMFE